MSIQATNSPWAATAPGAGSASPPPGGVAADKPQKSQTKATTGDSTGENGKPFYLFGKDGLTFGDLIDAVNPLQQLPIVSQIYREITGAKLSPASELLGSTLYFGPFGAAGAAADVLVQYETGEDIGTHVVDLLEGRQPATVQTAKADKAKPTTLAAGTEGKSGAAKVPPDPVSEWAARQTAGSRAQATSSGSSGSPQLVAVTATAPANDATGGALWPASLSSLDASRFLGGGNEAGPQDTAAPPAPGEKGFVDVFAGTGDGAPATVGGAPTWLSAVPAPSADSVAAAMKQAARQTTQQASAETASTTSTAAPTSEPATVDASHFLGGTAGSGRTASAGTAGNGGESLAGGSQRPSDAAPTQVADNRAATSVPHAGPAGSLAYLNAHPLLDAGTDTNAGAATGTANGNGSGTASRRLAADKEINGVIHASAHDGTHPTPPAGAVSAAPGGWFAQTMLSALKKYHEMQKTAASNGAGHGSHGGPAASAAVAAPPTATPHQAAAKGIDASTAAVPSASLPTKTTETASRSDLASRLASGDGPLGPQFMDFHVDPKTAKTDTGS